MCKIITGHRCESYNDNIGNPVVLMILQERNLVKSLVENVAKKRCFGFRIHLNLDTITSIPRSEN